MNTLVRLNLKGTFFINVYEKIGIKPDYIINISYYRLIVNDIDKLIYKKYKEINLKINKIW